MMANNMEYRPLAERLYNCTKKHESEVMDYDEKKRHYRWSFDNDKNF
jgi:hypothetical protein